MTELPSRTRRRQPPDETRAIIVETADRMLRERPFRELSVDEVMRPTGYGRTVFYRHFSGMPDLVTAVLVRVMPTLIAANHALLEAAGEEITRESAAAVLVPVVAHWRAHGTLMQAMRDAAVYDAEIEAMLEGAQSRQVETTIAAVRRRQEAGFLAGTDPEQLATALLALNIRYLLVTYGTPDAPIDDAVAVDTLALLWVAALTAP